MSPRLSIRVLCGNEQEDAVLVLEGTVLPAIIGPIKLWRVNACEVAEFCRACIENGSVELPCDLGQMQFDALALSTKQVVARCADLLSDALRLASNFPVKIGPEDGYVAAASKGKLIEFDLAAKAIVDEISCGGFVQGWSAADAFAALIEALERNDWDIMLSLEEASRDQGALK